MFRQSFLYDTLDMTADMSGTQIHTQAGASMAWLKRGVLEVTPNNVTVETKSIVISAGVHGNETAPLELVDAIVSRILDGSLIVQERCLFVLAYPQAINQKTRFMDENLNRLFYNGVKGNSGEIGIAKALMADVSAFFASTPESQRWHLDLHCAIRRSKHLTFAVSPNTVKNTRSKALFSFVNKACLGAVVLSQERTNTFSCYSANTHGAQALTVELGQVSPLGENDLSLIKDFHQALDALLSNCLTTPSSLIHQHPNPSIIYRVCQSLQRTQDHFDFNFDDTIKNFTRFERGAVLGHDGEHTLTVKEPFEAVVFPNKHVAIGSRAALMVTEVDIRFQDNQLVYASCQQDPSA